eukprot:9358160-Lingulodinium_polyedra.AAC.1
MTLPRGALAARGSGRSALLLEQLVSELGRSWGDSRSRGSNAGRRGLEVPKNAVARREVLQAREAPRRVDKVRQIRQLPVRGGGMDAKSTARG